MSEAPDGTTSGSVPAWRLALGGVVLVVLAVLGIALAPLYFRNLQFQEYVDDLAKNPQILAKPDDVIRTTVLEKAASMDLPVTIEDIQVKRADNALSINVKYVARVSFPLYTVNLHFYPGAGSQ